MSDDSLPDVSGDWFAAMRRGDWEAAWRATDRIELPRRARQGTPGFCRRPEQLRWDGTPTQGRSVIVRCEHGLGDTLQFMRFLPELGAARLHFLVQPPLVDLLRGVPGLGEVRNYWTDDPLPPHEVDLEVMELAYALRMTLERLPPPPSAQLRSRLPQPRDKTVPDDDRLRVGLVWASSPWDTTRSIGLQALAPLFALPEIRFFSLQQGEPAHDPLLQGLDIEILSPHTTDVRAAAAAMCALDLVIAVDAMPVHLAGTLGVPTWVLLKHQADWRWMQGRDDTPWYPALRLFRQPQPGDWDAVAQRVAAALHERALAHAGRARLSEAVPAR
ncbi:hypothetical protein JJB11_22940 [Ramlibacter ginsenosidimutans]|uniref:Glycosyltransferase family 9 protein n=1 Tax=Ramlibacter ginsenosidimutans TaxID=502333 RepID=A0A934TWX6_9BURK|nr:hypothetical protein [Ramlibacter ginsenosidimutans]MBK6008964.1 hypothetical protein [Ramlibacter ginsenosidimutans]